jgi:hypothetical protein
MERNVSRRFFCSKDIASGVGRTCFQGKAVGGPDGGKAGFKGNAVRVLFLSAPAFAGKSETDYCNQQGTDERSAHQFPPFYRSWSNHSSANVVKKFGLFLTAYHKI